MITLPWVHSGSKGRKSEKVLQWGIQIMYFIFVIFVLSLLLPQSTKSWLLVSMEVIVNSGMSLNYLYIGKFRKIWNWFKQILCRLFSQYFYSSRLQTLFIKMHQSCTMLVHTGLPVETERINLLFVHGEKYRLYFIALHLWIGQFPKDPMIRKGERMCLVIKF